MSLALKTKLFSLIQQNSLAKHCYLVGGYLRDELLNKESLDFDFAVEKENGAELIASELHKLFPNEFSSPHRLGAQYPIWQITWNGIDLQFSDTHKEIYPDQNSRHRKLTFAPLDVDCKRRDFTINMLYQRVSDLEMLNPSDSSYKDIKNSYLQVYPGESSSQILSEDPLRIIRFLRFSSCLNMQGSPELNEAIKAIKSRLSIVSVERIRDEWMKSIQSGALLKFLELSKDYDLLDILFPELVPMIGCSQDNIYHSEGDVWTHTLLVIKNSKPSVTLQLAALLHDIGKPATRSVHGERVKFLGHEKISAEMAKEFLEKRKFPKNLSEDICKLVLLHLRGCDCQSWKGLKAARRFIRDSEPLTEELIDLIRADSQSSLGQDGNARTEHIAELERLIAQAKLVPISKTPILNGSEIMKALQIKPSPLIGEIQKKLLDYSDECAEKNMTLDKAQAIEWLESNAEHLRE